MSHQCLSRKSYPFDTLIHDHHLALILYEGNIYNLSTYKGGKVTSINHRDNCISLIIETRRNKLEINAEVGASVDLKSPLKGEMTGRTIESL